MKRFFLMAVLLTPLLVNADVLLIDRVEAKAGIDIPSKSSTMTQVKDQFGPPIQEFAAVGNPPITRWEYANFMVYFEHQHVITTVLKKSKPTEKSPKPVE